MAIAPSSVLVRRRRSATRSRPGVGNTSAVRVSKRPRHAGAARPWDLVRRPRACLLEVFQAAFRQRGFAYRLAESAGVLLRGAQLPAKTSAATASTDQRTSRCPVRSSTIQRRPSRRGPALRGKGMTQPRRVSLTAGNCRSSEEMLCEIKMTFFIVHLLRSLGGRGGGRAGVQSRTLPLTRPAPGAILCVEPGTRERAPRLG